MKITSINRGFSKTIDFNGEKVSTGIYKSPAEGAVNISRLGIADDVIVDTSVHGGFDQAVYLYSVEDYRWWAKEVGEDLLPGTFGENLTTEGLELCELVIGDQLKIGAVVLEITAPRTPCFKLATRMGDPTFAKKFVRAARPGAYARVLQEGMLNVGDSIELEKTKGDFASVVEVFNAWHDKTPDPTLFLKALQSPIGMQHKKSIQAHYYELSSNEVN